MKIIETTIDKIKNYRTDYLRSLSQFQELFLELMINNSDFYALQFDNKLIGYAIRNREGVLIEYYIKNEYMPCSK